MASSFWKFVKGIVIKPETADQADNIEGSIFANSTSAKLKTYINAAVREIVTNTDTQALTNKTIDADSNTLSNIENADIKAAAAIARSKLASGSASHVIINDGSGVFSSEAQLNVSRGGTGVDGTGKVFVNTVDAQTLTNKSLEDSTTFIIDNADNTRKAQFQASGISASTTRTFTFPDADTTLVGTDVSQALTNKTIDGDNNTVQDLALTSLKTVIGDANKFLVRDGSGIAISNTKDVPSGTVVGTSDTQNLSAKTFTDATLFKASIQLEDPGAGTNKITMQAPTLSGDYTLTLPVDDGTSGQVLSTNGTGVLSWATAASSLTVKEEGTSLGSSFTALNFIGSTITATDAGAGQANITVTAAASTAFGGGGTLAKTANYTLVSGDSGKVILADTTGGAFTITLPAPSAGYTIVIKDSGGMFATNNLTVARNGSETIDGAAASTVMATAYLSIAFISDGTNWFKALDKSFVDPIFAARGIFGGDGNVGDTIDYISIPTTGNATDFGNLTVARSGPASFSSSTRGCWAGGSTGSVSNVIDYVTILTTGNATDFGDLTVARNATSGCSSSTRGLTMGGTTGSASNVIDYVTIASVGNATDFGDLTNVKISLGALASSTRACSLGGDDGASNLNIIDYVTIASTGNATDFGDLVVGTGTRNGLAGCSSSTRGLVGGGGDGVAEVNIIEYITIASTGNGTDFGDLTVTRSFLGGTSSSTRAVWAGGSFSGDRNEIDYVTIASTGNATDFGDLSLARRRVAGLSNDHGGL